ncbi:MAG: T9SS type A sorting domain-containing protein [Bacteroidales bacterium]|nr:T9SS type A sorting domain-containing protein [Bacteroidales bacterium]
MNKFCYTACCIFWIFSQTSAQDYRYVESIFPASVITSNVVYGSAPFLNAPYVDESTTTIQNLVMDIFQPQGDILNNRPAIIFAHGGGFLTGSRNVDDMVAFCDTFVRKGYVTVTIDYRQGVEVIDNSNLHYTRAAYRGLQDGRTAVRFLRANAASYGIDPDKIYFGGNSAGSFIGLNSIYLDPDEIPDYAGATSYTNPIYPFNTINAPDLGALDIGTNINFNGEPDAVMACWGGVGDTLIIEPDNDQSVFFIHGTADQIVPFNSGPPFNLSTVSAVYGSNSINTRLNTIGLPAFDTYFVQGQGHEFYGVTNGNWSNGAGGNAYWDTVIVKATRFFWEQHKPTASFNYVTNNLEVDFTDMSSGAISWLWDFGDGNTSTLQNANHTYLCNGTYTVQLYIENNIQSWDTITQKVTVPSSAIDEIYTNKFNAYPNPSNGLVTLYFDDFLHQGTLQIFNLFGQLIVEKVIQNGDQILLDLSGLENGIYFCKLATENQNQVRRIIISR